MSTVLFVVVIVGVLVVVGLHPELNVESVNDASAVQPEIEVTENEERQNLDNQFQQQTFLATLTKKLDHLITKL